MSQTELYRLGQNPAEIGTCRNAWRGGMYIWDDIAKRYFGLKGFPMFDEGDRNRVWNAYDHVPMPRHEIIVLLSTMDKATVRAEDIGPVADAFEQYAKEHPNSSIGEQAAILRSATFQPGDIVAWNQTSVCSFWGLVWDEETEEENWYDPNQNTAHFDAYADAMAATAVSGTASTEIGATD